MTKKRRPAKPRKRSKAPAPPQTLATIIIQPGNIIQDPGPMATFPGIPVSWLVINNDEYPHVVSIDAAKIKHKNNNRFEHPFRGQTHLTSKRLNHGDQGVLWAMTENMNIFKNPHEKYKYTIDSSGTEGTASTLDPDLDVIEPSPRLFFPPSGPDRPASSRHLQKRRIYQLAGPRRRSR
jgi:hypothetical protein